MTTSPRMIWSGPITALIFYSMTAMGTISQTVDVEVVNSLAVTGGTPTDAYEDDYKAGLEFVDWSFQAGSTDSGSNPAYSLVNSPDWLTINDSTGEVTVDPTHMPHYDPVGQDATFHNDDVGTHSFTVQVYDGHDYATKTFDLTVYNRDPVAQPLPDVTEDTALSGIYYLTDDFNQPGQGNSVMYSFSDVDADGNPITAEDKAPNWLTINPYTGELTGTPTNKDVGAHSFYIDVWDRNEDYSTDGNNGHTIEMVTLVVDNNPVQFQDSATPPNLLDDPVVLTSTANEDQPWTYNIRSSDESDGGTVYHFVNSDSANHTITTNGQFELWSWNNTDITRGVTLDTKTGL